LAEAYELGRKEQMTKEQLVEFLRNSLVLKVEVTQEARRVICIRILLENEVITIASAPLD